MELDQMLNSYQVSAKQGVFSVNLVCKKELNLMLKVWVTSSQGAVGFELGGTDSFYQDFYLTWQ